MATTTDFSPPAEAPQIPGDPLALERQVCFALSVAARSVLSIYRPILEPMGLTHPQYLVMLALWGQSPLAVKELIEMLQLDGPTLSPMLKRLEAAGLVVQDPRPAGRAAAARRPDGQGPGPARAGAERSARGRGQARQSLGELEELRKGLTALNEAARRAGVKPSPSPPGTASSGPAGERGAW